ncbi:MAG: trehalose-phosphatase [Gammaproteobacteria bacterium]|nr:trehalose-phosphatase [Gammaproteobacteria bacterium]
MIAHKLPAPEKSALFLDVDGTLLDLADTPDGVVVSEATRGLLRALEARLDGAVALISGRSLDSLDALFAPLRMPAAGVHGLQRRDHNGQRSQRALPQRWHAALAPQLQRYVASHPGLELEDKGHALALHYRRAPDMQASAEALADELMTSITEPTRLLRGKKVLEFMPIGSDKGQAIREFMSEAPFQGRLPVFIGDDVTDEAGFLAVNAMQGCSIRVGDGAATAAQHRLDSVADVHTRLQRWLD